MRRSKATSSSDKEPDRRSRATPGLFGANGWRIGFHGQLLLQLEKLLEAVEEERRRHPGRPARSQAAQILASLRKLMFVDVPADPSREIYRHGGTLRGSRKHWFRAKFGNGRYRLFFRFRTSEKVLIFAWVNDENSLRTYGSSTDAYVTFAGMLDRDDPPDDWDALLEACTRPEVVQRFRRILDRISNGGGDS